MNLEFTNKNTNLHQSSDYKCIITRIKSISILSYIRLLIVQNYVSLHIYPCKYNVFKSKTKNKKDLKAGENYRFYIKICSTFDPCLTFTFQQITTKSKHMYMYTRDVQI